MESGRRTGQTLSRCHHLAAKYTLFVLNFFITVGGFCLITIGIVAVKKEPYLTSLDDVVVDPTVFLLYVGSIMVVIGGVGCMGPLREHILLLKLFSAFVVLVFLMLIAGGILTYFYIGKVKDGMTVFLKKSIAHYQDDDHLKDAIDYIQRRFSCCGASNYTDWEHNIYYNCSSPAQSNCGVPRTCCKVTLVKSCGYKTRGFGEMYAAHTINTGGCVPHLLFTFRNHLLIVGGIALAIGVLEFGGLVLAIMLMKNIILLLKQQQNTTYISEVGDETHFPLEVRQNCVNLSKEIGEESCLNGMIEHSKRRYTENHFCANGDVRNKFCANGDARNHFCSNGDALLHNSYMPP